MHRLVQCFHTTLLKYDIARCIACIHNNNTTTTTTTITKSVSHSLFDVSLGSFTISQQLHLLRRNHDDDRDLLATIKNCPRPGRGSDDCYSLFLFLCVYVLPLVGVTATAGRIFLLRPPQRDVI